MSEDVVFLSVKENKLQDKEHEFLPLTWAYFSSHMENGKRVISQNICDKCFVNEGLRLIR